MIGLGVLVNNLFCDRRDTELLRSAIGKTIASVSLVPVDPQHESGALHIRFDDGSGIAIFDDGQSCCETRYMTCDDDLTGYVGATLVDAGVRDGGTVEGEYGDEHETQFLLVLTTLGTITCCTHNEHNGYYGGFALRVRALDPQDAVAP